MLGAEVLSVVGYSDDDNLLEVAAAGSFADWTALRKLTNKDNNTLSEAIVLELSPKFDNPTNKIIVILSDLDYEPQTRLPKECIVLFNSSLRWNEMWWEAWIEMSSYTHTRTHAYIYIYLYKIWMWFAFFKFKMRYVYDNMATRCRMVAAILPPPENISTCFPLSLCA